MSKGMDTVEFALNAPPLLNTPIVKANFSNFPIVIFKKVPLPQRKRGQTP